MVKIITVDKHDVIISDNSITVKFGYWSWSAWMNGRKEQHNSVKPAKPINKMTAVELKALAKEAVIAGKEEKKRLDNYFAGLGK